MTASYTFGTVTVSQGSTTVTGDGTGWLTSNIAPGYFGTDSAGSIPVPVAAVVSDTELTLVSPWRGADATASAYWLSYDTRDGQQTVNNAQRLADYIARLDSRSLAAIAGLTPEDQTIILFTGSTSATLLPVGQIGGLFDVQVNTLADRAAYDGRPTGYRVLVSNVGDGIAALYTKRSDALADWSDPAYVTGPTGATGDPGPYTDFVAGTTTTLPAGSQATFALRDVSEGVKAIDVGLPRGLDGTGIGDMLKSVYDPTNQNRDAFQTIRTDAAQTLTAAQKGQAIANVGGGVLAGFRNKIINGKMAIAQRYPGSALGPGFCADRFFVNGTTAQAIANLTDAERAIVGFDAKKSLTAYAPSGNVIAISQGIEGVETLAGKKATLTFYARGSAGGMPVSAELRQVFGTGGSPSGNVVTAIPLSVTTLPTGFTKIIGLVDVPPVSGKTLGSSGNDALYLVISRGSGVDGNIILTKISLVEGDATKEDDPFSPRHIQQEIALCQRYYYAGGLPLVGLSLGATQVARMGAPLPVRMRTTPTVSVSGYVFDGGIAPISGGLVNYSQPDGIEIDVSVSGGMTAGNPARLLLYYGTDNFYGRVTADADI